MIKVNLVPADILAKAAQRQQALQAAVAGVALLLVVALVSVGHWARLTRLERRLAKNESDLKKLEVIVKKVEELEKTVAAVKARLNVITDLLKGRTMYPYFMSDFARSVPGGVRVVSMTTAGGGSSAAPLKLTITAEAMDTDDIAAWVKKMEESGRFTFTELGPVTQPSATDRVSNFSLTTTYTPQL